MPSFPKLSSDWKTGGLVLELEASLLWVTTKATIAEELWLLPKPKFHLTILGSKVRDAIFALRPDATKEEQENILLYAEQLAENFDWEVTARDEYYLLKQDYNDDGIPETRTSLVQMLDVPDLIEYYRELNALLNTKFETPVAHVTLYSHSTRPEKMLRGIGVYTKAQLEVAKKEKI